MELKDLMELKAFSGGGGLSTYEQYKVGDMQRKNHTSGVGIAGLITGISGIIVGGAAWLSSSLYGNAKANQAKEAAQSAKELAANQYAAMLQLMNAQNANTNATLDRILHGFDIERAERITGDTNISQTITDSISGQQQGSQAQQNSIENSAVAQATAQIMAGLMTGDYAQCAKKVQLMSPETPFKCGCGCNG